jgi:hypothetical protein
MIPVLIGVHLPTAQAAVSLVVGVAIVIYFPDSPPTPASKSSDSRLAVNRGWRSLLHETLQCLKSASFVVLTLVCGLQMGMFAAWEGQFEIMLAPLGKCTAWTESMQF